MRCPITEEQLCKKWKQVHLRALKRVFTKTAGAVVLEVLGSK